MTMEEMTARFVQLEVDNGIAKTELTKNGIPGIRARDRPGGCAGDRLCRWGRASGPLAREAGSRAKQPAGQPVSQSAIQAASYLAS